MATKDKNVLAQLGHSDYTDQDYIDRFGLDPEKDINTQMFNQMEQENITFYMADMDMSEKAAKIKAAQKKAEAMTAFYGAMKGR